MIDIKLSAHKTLENRDLFNINGFLFSKVNKPKVTNIFSNMVYDFTSGFSNKVDSIYCLSWHFTLLPFLDTIEDKSIIKEYHSQVNKDVSRLIKNKFSCANELYYQDNYLLENNEIDKLFYSDDLTFPSPFTKYKIYQNKFYDKYLIIHFQKHLDQIEGYLLINLK